jgi:gamma-glutamyltranspeptidase
VYQIEAFKFMFSDRMAMGDPQFVDGLQQMEQTIVSAEHARQLKERISLTQTFAPEHYEDLVPLQGSHDDAGTTHFCVVDQDGNAVALTSTV